MKKEELDEIISNTDEKILGKAENVKQKRGITVFRIAAVAALFAVLFAVFALPMMNRPGVTPPDTPPTEEQVTSGTADTVRRPDDQNTWAVGKDTEEAVTIEEFIATYGKFLHYDPVYPTQTVITSNDIEAAYEAFNSAYEARQAHYGYGKDLGTFFNNVTKAVKEYARLSGKTNVVLSPLNIYMGLSLIGEMTKGETQKQIFDVLKVNSLEQLRTKTRNIWLAHYCDNGTYKSLLANSVWLDNDNEYVTFNEDKIKTVQDEYYASAFSGDLQSDDFIKVFRTWMNDQTGGSLKDMIDGIKITPETIMLIASTVDFSARFEALYAAEQGVFKNGTSNIKCTFNKSEFWGEDMYFGNGFNAYAAELENNAGRMWYILPDEGYTVDEILDKLDLYDLQRTIPATRVKCGKLTVKMPQLDVALQTDLKETLPSLGITECFNFSYDFAPTVNTGIYPVCVGQALHGARVMTDEKGVVGSAFTFFALELGSVPPEGDEYEFIVDRPFIFVIESDDGLPLFVGIVNEP